MKFVKRFIKFYQEEDGVVFWSAAITILISLFVLVLWLVNLNKLPYQIPLFFSLPWGEDQLGTLNQFIILPSIILLTLLVNLIISWHLHPSQQIIKRMLSISSVIVAVLILVSSCKIILTLV